MLAWYQSCISNVVSTDRTRVLSNWRLLQQQQLHRPVQVHSQHTPVQVHPQHTPVQYIHIIRNGELKDCHQPQGQLEHKALWPWPQRGLVLALASTPVTHV